MALVECPNCGRNISENSKTCISCHTDLRKCPECGALAIEREGSCPKCGCSFEVEEKATSPEQSAAELDMHVREFKRQNKFLAFISMQPLWSTIAVVIMLSGLIPVIVELASIFENIKKAPGIGQMYGFIDAMFLLFALISVGALFKLIPFWVSEATLPLRLQRYGSENELNFIFLIKNTSKCILSNAMTIFGSRKLNFEAAKNGEYGNACPEQYKKYVLANLLFIPIKVIIVIAEVISLVRLSEFFKTIMLLDPFANEGQLLGKLFTSGPAIFWYFVLAADIAFSIVRTVIILKYMKARDYWVANL